MKIEYISIIVVKLSDFVLSKKYDTCRDKGEDVLSCYLP